MALKFTVKYVVDLMIKFQVKRNMALSLSSGRRMNSTLVCKSLIFCLMRTIKFALCSPFVPASGSRCAQTDCVRISNCACVHSSVFVFASAQEAPPHRTHCGSMTPTTCANPDLIPRIQRKY